MFFILNIIRHILNIILYFRGSQCRRTREGDVGDNLGVRETKRTAELKTLYKGFKDVSGKP